MHSKFSTCIHTSTHCGTTQDSFVFFFFFFDLIIVFPQLNRTSLKPKLFWPNCFHGRFDVGQTARYYLMVDTYRGRWQGPSLPAPGAGASGLWRTQKGSQESRRASQHPSEERSTRSEGHRQTRFLEQQGFVTSSEIQFMGTATARTVILLYCLFNLTHPKQEILCY